MVVQRTLDKIDELKERPHHERRTIALYGAIIVAGFFLLFWGFFAVRKIGHTAVQLSKDQDAMALSVSSQAASAAAAGAETSASPSPSAQLTASSTNGYVDLVPARQ